MKKNYDAEAARVKLLAAEARILTDTAAQLWEERRAIVAAVVDDLGVRGAARALAINPATASRCVAPRRNTHAPDHH